MTFSVRLLVLLGLVLTAALFGFFYAWVCSTMWGLDSADPRVAIAAMQSMNASVRNMVFAPAFFGTPVVLGLSTVVLWLGHRRAAAIWFGTAAALVIGLGFVLTMLVNVPMNQALAALEAPTDLGAAQMIWDDYSPRWQVFNQIRAAATGIAVLCVGLGFMHLQPKQAA